MVGLFRRSLVLFLTGYEFASLPATISQEQETILILLLASSCLAPGGGFQPASTPAFPA
jgi:hypothetical protein